MKIKKIIFNDKEIEFKNHNFLYSKDNGAGKTTFVRLMLYAMGWKIPSTYGLKFSKCSTTIEFERDSIMYKFEREGDLISVSENGNFIKTYSVQSETNEIVAIFSGLKQPELIENLLGIIYFDQEKGWTLLNRGIVIGKIRFNVEDFLAGLNESNQIESKQKIQKLDNEIKSYELLKNNLKHQDNEVRVNGQLDWTNFDRLNDRERSIKLELTKIQRQIKSLENVQQNNTSIQDMILSLGLGIKTEKGVVELTEDNIDGLQESKSIIEARLALLKRNLKDLYTEKYQIESSLKEQTKLFDMKTQLDRFHSAISQLRLNVSSVESVINEYKQEKRQLSEKIKQELKQSSYLRELHDLILKFSEVLEIGDFVKGEKEFVLTKELKTYSGATLHLLVFCFKMADLYLLQKTTRETYPIILDSPFSSEVKVENVRKMYYLLDEFFPNNQIFTASVEQIENISSVDRKIVFNGNIASAVQEY